MRATKAAVALVALGAVAAAAGCSADPGGGGPQGRSDGSHGWQRLPDPPLSPRNHAVVVGVEDRMLVVGGWELLCPPSADCVLPEGPLLDDGAVYDRVTGSWSTTAPPPFGVRRGEYATAALDGSAYVLTGCADGPSCGARPRLLSYDVAADDWTDHGPVPGPKHVRHLATLGRTLLVYSGSDEGGEVDDLLFDPSRARWTELPDDPLPRTFDRFLVPVRGQVVLTGAPMAAAASGDDAPTRAARLDLASGAWSALPDAPGQGYQLFATDRGALLNGHFIDSPGWLLDPDTWSWSALPEHAGERPDLSGVLGREGATYDIPNSVGQMTSSVRVLVYDSDAGTFVTVPPPRGREDVYDDSSTALGRDLFVHGGQQWSGDGLTGEGELVGDAWLWTAPAGARR